MLLFYALNIIGKLVSNLSAHVTGLLMLVVLDYEIRQAYFLEWLNVVFLFGAETAGGIFRFPQYFWRKWLANGFYIRSE